MRSISILIPAYNEEMRLPETLRSLKEFIQNTSTEFRVVEVIVVDDGSTDQTSVFVDRFAHEWPLLKLKSLDRNFGKGSAVHKGLSMCQGDWVLIADADMATPWEELQKLWSAREGQSLVMGSRGLPASCIEVRQHWLRQGLGKTFNKFLRLISGLTYSDTQCGFKLLLRNSTLVQDILPHLTVRRFAWDVELILALHSFNGSIREIPIRWFHREASKVHLVFDSLEMLWAVLKMKSRRVFFLIKQRASRYF